LRRYARKERIELGKCGKSNKYYHCAVCAYRKLLRSGTRRNQSILVRILCKCFLLISGYLLFRKQLNKPAIEAGSVQYIIGDGKKLMFNILYRMYIPMIIFSAIEFLPKIMITHRAFEFNTLLIETVGAGTYWFTSALLIAEVIIALLLVTRR